MVILVSLVFPLFVEAQVVTASQDPTVLSLNPAATPFRKEGGAFADANIQEREISGNEIDSDANRKWEVTENQTTLQTLLTGRGWRIVPELLVARQTVKTTWNVTDNTGVEAPSKAEEEYEVENYILNLGVRLFPFLSIGGKYQKGVIEGDNDINFNFGGYEYSEDTVSETDLSTYGMGVTLRLPFNIYLGYSNSLSKLSSSNTFMESSSDGNNSFSESGTSKGLERIRVENYGLGIIIGKKSRVFRLELSQNINRGLFPGLKAGRKNSLSFEGYTTSFYGRLAFSQLRGDYINLNNIVSAIISDRVNSNNTTNEFSGSGGFKTKKGHQIGLAVSYSSSSAPVRLAYTNEDLFNSDIILMSASLSYAYLF